MSQSSGADPQAHMLRKRQSFSFGDNRLGPALLAHTAQTDTHPVTQSAAAAVLAASSGSAAIGGAAEDAVQQLDPVPGLPRSAAGWPKPSLGQAAQSTAATQPGLDSSRAHAVKMSWSVAGSSSSGRPEAGKGRPAANAGATIAPAAAGSTKAPAGATKVSGQGGASKSPKPARPHKADWQH